MGAAATTATTEPAQTYRLSTVIGRLEAAGFEAHKDSVKRASDKFLCFDTLSRGGHRRWTDEEIDQLIVAYRLRHECGIQWPRIAEIFASDVSLEEHLALEIAAMQQEIEALGARRTGSEGLLRDLADSQLEDQTTAA